MMLISSDLPKMIRSCSVIYAAHITHTNDVFQRVDLMIVYSIPHLICWSLDLLVTRAFVFILVVLYQHNTIFRCTPPRGGSHFGQGVVLGIVLGPMSVACVWVNRVVQYYDTIKVSRDLGETRRSLNAFQLRLWEQSRIPNYSNLSQRRRGIDNMVSNISSWHLWK